MMPYTLYFYLYSINYIGLCCSLIWSQKILDESWVWIIQMLSLIWSVIALYKAGFLAANCSRFFKTSIISSADGSLLCWFSFLFWRLSTRTLPTLIVCKNACKNCWGLYTRTGIIQSSISDIYWKLALTRWEWYP